MAPDQRYCIQCGERRSGGGLRDALPRTQTAAPAAASSRQRPWLSPSSSLITGVATLLLALGVGVLIGRSGNDAGPARAATPQIVTVAGVAPSASTTTGTTGSSTAASTKTAAKTKAKHTAAKAKVTGASSVDATAKKNGVKLPPKVVKVGQKCQTGAKGCQGGKFTGNFFGGG